MNAIIPHQPQNTGAALYRASTDAAGLCKAIVLQTAQKIQGRSYVRCEGWQAIAIAHGCVASAGDVENIEGGVRAIGRVFRMEDGHVIATAEGFVGEDEKMWAGRPVYARRAMAQTRAISRACRAAFAHVVVMMNAGLETTPAEEVPDEGFNSAPVQHRAQTAGAGSGTPPQRAPAPATNGEPKKMTLREWMASFKASLEVCRSQGDISELVAGDTAMLEWLSENKPTLRDEVDALIAERSAAIEGGV